MRHPTGHATLLAILAAAVACSEPETVERATVHPAADVTARHDPGDVRVCVDTARSLIRWRGTEVAGGGHEGVVRLSRGYVQLRDAKVIGGQFTVDMRTIAITDIPGREVEARRRLRSHLAHEEFLGVDRFPVARFVITRVQAGEHDIYTVAGNLAIRDSIHNVAFEAMAPVVTPRAVWATADFGIDRQLWGIDFDGRTSALRNAIVRDLIQLEVTLVADRDRCDVATPAPGVSGAGSSGVSLRTASAARASRTR